jgi:hypothetical protein
LFKEEAYLYAKMEREEEAITVLIKNCSDLSETIEFVLKFKFSKMDAFWDKLIAFAANDNEKVN